LNFEIASRQSINQSKSYFTCGGKMQSFYSLYFPGAAALFYLRIAAPGKRAHANGAGWKLGGLFYIMVISYFASRAHK